MRCFPAGLLALALLLAAAPVDGQVDWGSTLRLRSIVAGGQAPDYHAQTLGGDSLRLSDLRGDVVLLNVWATWCRPCLLELPLFQQLHDRYGEQGLRVVGISIDQMPPRAIANFLRRQKVTYTNVKDRPTRMATVFGFQRAVPQTLLIAPNGQVVGYWLGEIDAKLYDQIEARVRALLPGRREEPADEATRVMTDGAPRGATDLPGVVRPACRIAHPVA